MTYLFIAGVVLLLLAAALFLAYFYGKSLQQTEQAKEEAKEYETIEHERIHSDAVRRDAVRVREDYID